MNVTLVSINSKYVHSSLGVWYIRAAAEQYAPIHIVESTVKEGAELLLKRIEQTKPDIVGFSCYIWNIEVVRKTVEILKRKLPKCIVLLGGPEVSYNAEQVLAENPHVAYIISGEGEEPFCELLTSLENDQSTDGISGLCSATATAEPHLSYATPISPYTEHYLQALGGRISYIETSRGCPYSCTYCLSGRLCAVRFFDLQKVKSDIDILATSGTQTIKFVDRTFNCNAKRAVEIIKYIKQKHPVYKGICYHFEMAGDILTPELLCELNTAPSGLFQVEIGIQSYNADTLCAVNRRTNLDFLQSNIRKLLVPQNVHVHVDLIAGLPFEDFESFARGFNLCFDLHPHMLQLGFLKLLHGSEMERSYKADFGKKPPYEIVQNDWLCQKDFERLKLAEDAVDRLYNSGRFSKVVELAAAKTGDAFEVFLDFGTKNAVSHGQDLYDYSEKVLHYFSDVLGERVTKDALKEQWLAVNSSGKLPPCLREESMGSLLKLLDREHETRRKAGVRRAAAVLYGRGELIYVDYESEDPVTGRYKVNRQKWAVPCGDNNLSG